MIGMLKNPVNLLIRSQRPSDAFISIGEMNKETMARMVPNHLLMLISFSSLTLGLILGL
ncbi:Uncharacterised protein [Mycobacteroides abscessus subsp. abscessus]|nr:Uncharacterised protein [Mycobacteroides abscessus subsp. abscessus]